MAGRIFEGALGVAVAATLSACGGGGGAAYSSNVGAQAGAPVQTCVECAANTVPRFAYALNAAGATLSIYNVDATTGQLRPRGYVKTGANPVSAVSDAKQRFMFVLNQGTVSAYAFDNITGDLKEVSGSPYPVSSAATSHIAVHPSGKFVYVVGADAVYGWSINAATGQLTPIAGGAWRTGASPQELIFDPAGQFAYVANRDSNNVFVYDVDATTGALTRRWTQSVPSAPASLTLSPGGEFAYVVSGSESASGSLSAFAIDAVSGELHPIDGSPYALGAYPAQAPVLFHPSGKFAYVRNVGAPGAAGSLSVFSVDVESGALVASPGASAIGINSSGASMDPSGRFLYVVNKGDSLLQGGSISAFSVDAATGELVPTNGISTLRPVPSSGSIDPSGKFFYAPSAESDQLYTFDIDQATGALSVPSQGAAMRTGAQPLSLAVYASTMVATPPVFRSKLAYVPNAASNSISAFTIDATTGSLGVIGTAAAAGDAPQAVAVAQGSKFLYSAYFQGSVSGYSINGASGTLQQVNGGDAAAGLGPTTVAIDPSRRFAYVVNSGDRTLSVFKIDAVSGALVPHGNPIATIAQPLAAVVDPTGRNLFVSSLTQIQVFAINSLTGGLMLPVSGGNGVKPLLTAGTTQIAVDPRGKFLYAANPGAAGSIEIYPIDPYSGVLGPASALVTNRQNGALSIDPTGRFLYTADFGSNSITRYAINQMSGQLAAAASVGANGAEFVTADYSGKYLYAVLQNNSVAAYSINQTNGALTVIAGGGAATQTNPGPLVTVGEVE